MKALIAILVIAGGLAMFWFLGPYVLTGGPAAPDVLVMGKRS